MRIKILIIFKAIIEFKEPYKIIKKKSEINGMDAKNNNDRCI